MDYVLSITDNLFFDYLYAKALPAHTDISKAAEVVAEFVNNAAANATLAGASQLIGANDPFSAFLGVHPTKYAVMSRLDRDDWRRQFISLFLITW